MSEDKPSLWNTVKKKTNAFVKRVLDYLPRGILMVGGLFATSAVLESATGYPFLEITKLAKTPELLLMRGALHLGVGSLIVGAMGAYLCPSEEKSPSEQIPNNTNGTKKELSNERARTQDIGDDFAISNTNHHLPNKPIELART